MRETFLVFGRPVIGQAEIDEVNDSLRSGWIGTGPKVQKFERMLEGYVGVEHVRCMSSCTAALLLALDVLDIGPGDEVIVPTMTFVASVNAVVHAGATPVLVDCDPDTFLADLDAVEAAITPRTKAFVPVHFSGRPLDMDRVNAIRDRHGIHIIEDAAHAIGTEWKGQRIGTHGNLTAYSFYVTKNITTGEGGALASNDQKVAERVERLALHGLSLGAWQRFSDAGFKHYEVEQPGYKMNMTDMQAALGIHQLPQLDTWIERRAELWSMYDEKLAGLPVRVPASWGEDIRHARHLYQVLVQDDSAVTRDELLGHLTKANIGTGVHYRGVHLHPYYRDGHGYRPEDFPNASDISDRTLSLPLNVDMTEGDVDDVVNAIAEAVGARAAARTAS